MAVLPTPGSPISTGLFLVRRESTCMTRRISSSRPITGSSLPARASSVRSRPYFLSAWNLPSGFWSVTRWRAAHLLDRLAAGVSRVTPKRARICGGRAAGDGGDREQKVLDRDVVVLELRRQLGGRVEHLAEVARRCRLGAALGAGQAVEVLHGPRRAAAEGDADLGEQPRRQPLLLLEKRQEQVGRHDLRVAAPTRRIRDGGLQRLPGLDGVVGCRSHVRAPPGRATFTARSQDRI